METEQDLIPVHFITESCVKRLIACVIEEVFRNDNGELQTQFHEPILESIDELADVLRNHSINLLEDEKALHKIVQLMEDTCALAEYAEDIDIAAFDVFALVDAIHDIHLQITADDLCFSLSGFFNLPQELVQQVKDHQVFPHHKNLESFKQGVISYCHMALMYVFNPLIEKDCKSENVDENLTEYMLDLRDKLLKEGHIKETEYHFDLEPKQPAKTGVKGTKEKGKVVQLFPKNK